jgi:hypothetical protein
MAVVVVVLLLLLSKVVWRVQARGPEGRDRPFGMYGEARLAGARVEGDGDVADTARVGSAGLAGVR